MKSVLGVVLITSVVTRPVENWKDTWKGDLSMFGETVTAFDLPTYSPLIQMQVNVQLSKGESDVSEYPPIHPEVYLRFDAVPSHELYDIRGNIDNLHWHWEQHRPKKAQQVFIRVTGGLIDALQLQCAYTLRKWSVGVSLRYSHCPNDWEIEGNSTECDLKVIYPQQGSTYVTDNAYTTGRIDVPSDVSLLHLHCSFTRNNETMALIGPWNYAKIGGNGELMFGPETYFLENSDLRVANPRPGVWFIQIYTQIPVQFSYQLISQQADIQIHALDPVHEGSLPFTVSTVPIQYTIPMNHSIDLFALKAKSIYKKHTLKLVFSTIPQSDIDIRLYRGSYSPDTLYLRLNSSISNSNFLVNLDYLYSETTYLSLRLLHTSQYQIGLVSSACGVEACNGDPCERLPSPVPVSACSCRGPRAGTNCTVSALSGFQFAIWILFLTGSNLAMLLAIFVSFWRYGKYGEGCVFLCTMVTSFMYHFCDSQYFCFGLNSSGLRQTDFYVSYLSIVVSIIYLARLRSDVKLGVTMLYVILLLYAMTQTHFNALVAEVGIPASVGVVPVVVYLQTVVKFSRKLEGKQWSWRVFWRFLFCSGNFRWTYGVLAICSFSFALVVNFSLQTNSSYWLTHSLWHIFIMLTPACVLSVFPPLATDFAVEWETENSQPLL